MELRVLSRGSDSRVERRALRTGSGSTVERRELSTGSDITVERRAGAENRERLYGGALDGRAPCA